MSAVLALAAWPAFVRGAAAPDPILRVTPAPLRDDALIRAQTIAFEEKRVAADATDQITPRLLAREYLQRYRERGDTGDVLRAEAMARASLRSQPYRNVAARVELASALNTYHRFREALVQIRLARRDAPDDPSLIAQEASLDLEIGDIDAARPLIHRIGDGANPQSEVVTSRLYEITGRLADARVLLNRASHRADGLYELPAERRAWYHVRLGEMAFNAGDTAAADAEERIALERAPEQFQALTDLARFAAARRDWPAARDAAARAAAVRPNPENLGILADAADALHDVPAATRARDEIDAVRHIGNAQHLYDRFLALYDADHGVALTEAYAIARREITIRHDPYAEDTLAWAAAKSGRWAEAATAAARAARYGTEDTRLRAHAAYIAHLSGTAR